MVSFQVRVFEVMGHALPESSSRSLATEVPTLSFINIVSVCL